MNRVGLFPNQRLFTSSVACWCLLLLLAGGDSVRARPVRPAPTSLEDWRRLTEPPAASPTLFVNGDNIRLYLADGAAVEAFSTRWPRVRIAVDNFRVSSAILRWDRTLSHVPSGKRGWREARVITRAEWERLAGSLIDDLTPKQPGRAAAYQALFADVVMHRNADGQSRIIGVQDEPGPFVIEHRYSLEETLDRIARLLQDHLGRAYPSETLFLVMAATSGRASELLLLDSQLRRCISLTPAALLEANGRGRSLAAGGQLVSAALWEGHGLALMKNPVSSAARLANLAVETIINVTQLPLPRAGKFIPPITTNEGMDLNDWENWLDHKTGTRRERGSLRLLIDGDSFFPRLQQQIAAATNHIHFQIYIFDRDDIGIQIADQLRQRSRDVQVKVSMDRLVSIAAGLTAPATPMPRDFAPPPSIAAYLRKDSRVQVRPFLNPWFSADHSKLLLVDGVRAWVGGMNFGREYRYEWHDLMVEMEGPIVSSFEDRFRLDWAHAGLWGDLAYAAALVRHPVRNEIPPEGNYSAAVRRLPTTTTTKPFAAAVFGSIQRARSYVYVENPYLFDRRVIAALVRARLRGVDVRVVLPRVNDFEVRARSNVAVANYLLQQGVRVFFYPGMTHVKALLVDDWACLGSANLDHLSLRLNQEQNIASADPNFTTSLKRDLFQSDFARSHELTQPLPSGWLDSLATLVLESF